MNKLLIAILVLSIYSCKISVDTSVLDQDSRDIYSLSIANTTGSDTIFRYHLRIPPPLPTLIQNAEDSIENLQYKRWQDSVRQLLSTAELFVVVNHKIDTLPKSDIESILKTISFNRDNMKYKIKGDTSFNDAIRELCNNKLDFDTIDVRELRTKFNYKIYSDRNFPDDKIHKIGTVRLSKIAFSDNRSKAAVYTSFICGGLCGSGQILFFQKINRAWNYINSWDLWVA
ncbi:MAG: hypothetical protein QM727_03615 [Niabella sp.]